MYRLLSVRLGVHGLGADFLQLTLKILNGPKELFKVELLQDNVLCALNINEPQEKR